MPQDDLQDAVIIGGGFYGCLIGIYLSHQRGFKNITLIEQAGDLLTRASTNNQARVHNGCHYPRSFTTAYRSQVNLPHFLRDWSGAINTSLTKIYAIARKNSKINSAQFERFCHRIGVTLGPVAPELQALFDPRMIEKTYVVNEYVFDAIKLAQKIKQDLNICGIRISLETTALNLSSSQDCSTLTITNKEGAHRQISAKYIFNCTYSGLNQIRGDFAGIKTLLKHEITEMPLVDVPPIMQNLGITVMDGPFFSLLPFPSRHLHTVSHVRYTPHVSWNDDRSIDPYQRLRAHNRATRIDRMTRDIARYIPSFSRAKYIESLFEVKTILVKNESDDGRPILFERHEGLHGVYSVLGGKIDNIYDILEKLDSEQLSLA